MKTNTKIKHHIFMCKEIKEFNTREMQFKHTDTRFVIFIFMYKRFTILKKNCIYSKKSNNILLLNVERLY